MADKKYLDETGLAHAWAKIKEWLGGGTIKVYGNLTVDEDADVEIGYRKIRTSSQIDIEGYVQIPSGSQIVMSGNGRLSVTNNITIQAQGSGNANSAYSKLGLRNDGVNSNALSNELTFTAGKTWAEFALSSDCGIHLATNSNKYTTISNMRSHTTDLIFIYNTSVGGAGGTTGVSMKHARLGPNEKMNYTNYTEGTFFIMFWISRFDLD